MKLREVLPNFKVLLDMKNYRTTWRGETETKKKYRGHILKGAWNTRQCSLYTRLFQAPCLQGTKVARYSLGIVVVKGMITHGPPPPVVEDLHPSSVTFWEPDGQPARFSRGCRQGGRGRGRGQVVVTDCHGDSEIVAAVVHGPPWLSAAIDQPWLRAYAIRPHE